MSTTALTTAGRFLVRRKRPNRPSVDNAFPSSWCPHFGVQFIEHDADIHKVATRYIVDVTKHAIGVGVRFHLKTLKTSCNAETRLSLTCAIRLNA